MIPTDGELDGIVTGYMQARTVTQRRASAWEAIVAFSAIHEALRPQRRSTVVCRQTIAVESDRQRIC
jgi:hypothetical protein